ncbi:MAG: hypothetical protein JSV52_15410 [Candidatus Zixiibacteriota bacterium]|nr:MAG: hypothetical protein JSV52_15410 [candidate division Zixibacteria bacterium]
MFRQIVSSVTLAAFLLYSMGLTGCTKAVRIPMSKVDVAKVERGVYPIKGSIKSLRKKDGTHVSFDGRHGRVDTATKAVVGYSPANEYVSVPLSEVAYLEVLRADEGKSSLALYGVLAGIGLFLVAVAEMGDFDWDAD